MKKYSYFLAFMGLFIACGDDDGLGIGGLQTVSPRLLSEVAPENDAEIQEYLQTHFYNYEEFQNPPENFDFTINIDTIAGENADRTPLIEQVAPITVNVSSEDFLLEDDEVDVPHTYYILIARQGNGLTPTFADSTFVRFEGSLLNGEVFDQVSTVSGFDLPSFQFPNFGSMRAFRGVAEGIQQLRAAESITPNPDGTFTAPGSGIGMVIFPSGLGTFNGFRSPIPQFSPLMFKLEILATIRADHDNDGIPSFLEDVDGDGIVINDNTDSDFFGLTALPNYLDDDDDGDGVPTAEEIEFDENGNLVFPDSDGDSVPDYLDGDS